MIGFGRTTRITGDPLAATAFARDMVEHIKQHMDPPQTTKSGFELGLDLLLEGLERAKDAAREGGSAGAS